MGIRFEKSGLHCYNRVSGIHVLLDEVRIDPDLVSLGPRTLSVAITNRCDFSCAHCHVKKGTCFIDADYIVGVCRACEQLGTLDIALGGGEPTIHTEFVSICRRIWTETQLGLSFTTHGHHLDRDLVQAIAGYVSFVRISVDGLEPIYSQLRGRPLRALLERIEVIRGVIPFGINVIVSSDTLHSLDELLGLALDVGAEELLLLPLMEAGAPILTDDEWRILSRWVEAHGHLIGLRLSTYARPFVEGPFLFDDPAWEEDYAYLAVDGTLRTSSYVETGVKLSDYGNFREGILAWRRQLTAQDEEPPFLHRPVNPQRDGLAAGIREIREIRG